MEKAIRQNFIYRRLISSHQIYVFISHPVRRGEFISGSIIDSGTKFGMTNTHISINILPGNCFTIPLNSSESKLTRQSDVD